MNTSLKKVAIALALAVGLAGSLALQAHEYPVTPNQGPATEGHGSMPMGMNDMKGMMSMMQMMGNAEQMSEMMAACAKLMKAHVKVDPASTDKSSEDPST
jgi:plastocyanin domain-containing protein